MDNLFNSGISIEKMAAFLDGNLSASEMKEISAVIARNQNLKQFVELSDYIDESIELPNIEKCTPYPSLAVAACTDVDNLCDICCEGYILRHFGIDVADEQLKKESIASGWLTSQGTQLQNIGNLSEAHDLHVERKYNATLENITSALSQGAMVMVCVDEGELTGNIEQEQIEDIIIGKCPDHVVIVSSVDIPQRQVTIIDPYTPQLSDVYPLELFMGAWEDSENYIIIIKK